MDGDVFELSGKQRKQQVNYLFTAFSTAPLLSRSRESERTHGSAMRAVRDVSTRLPFRFSSFDHIWVVAVVLYP